MNYDAMGLDSPRQSHWSMTTGGVNDASRCLSFHVSHTVVLRILSAQDFQFRPMGHRGEGVDRIALTAQSRHRTYGTLSLERLSP